MSYLFKFKLPETGLVKIGNTVCIHQGDGVFISRDTQPFILECTATEAQKQKLGVFGTGLPVIEVDKIDGASLDERSLYREVLLFKVPD